MPKVQFGASSVTGGSYGAKLISKWPMIVGVESSDKICHMTVHSRNNRYGKGLRATPAAKLLKSVDTEEVKPQISQITQIIPKPRVLYPGEIKIQIQWIKENGRRCCRIMQHLWRGKWVGLTSWEIKSCAIKPVW